MTLAIELSVDPLAIGYAAMSDAEVAASLAAPTRAIARPIPVAEAIGLIALYGDLLERLEAAAEGVASDAQRAARRLVLLTRGQLVLSVIDMTDPASAAGVTALLGVLVTAGVLADDERAALLALGLRDGSRAEELGLGYVTPSQVADARRIAS